MTISRKKLPVEVAEIIEELLLKDKSEITNEEFSFLRSRSDYLTVSEKIQVGILRPIIKRAVGFKN